MNRGIKPTIDWHVAHELIAQLRKHRNEAHLIGREDLSARIQLTIDYVEAQPKGEIPEEEGKVQKLVRDVAKRYEPC